MRSELQERSQCRQSRVAAAYRVVPFVLKMVEEGEDRRSAVERNRLPPRVLLVHARLARSRSQSMVTPDTEGMGV